METPLQESVQRRVSVWLKFFTGFSIGLSVLAAFGGDALFLVAVLTPMVHCALFWIVMFLRSMPEPWLSESVIYIREKHPDIWRRIVVQKAAIPNNSWAWQAFLNGKYDDGKDPHLQLIKARMRRHQNLTIWPFVLIPGCWIVAFAAKMIVRGLG